MSSNPFIQEFSKKNKPQFEKYKKYLETNDWTTSDISHTLTDEYFNDLYSNDDNKVKKAEISKMLKEQIAAHKDNIKYKTDEFKLQNELMLNILDRVKYFVAKTSGSDHSLQGFKNFIQFSLDIIRIHTDRVDDYVNSVDINKIANQEVRSEEIKLVKECFSGVTKIQDEIAKLNIKEEDKAQGIQWLDNQKATIAMHKDLIRLYPEIQVKLDEMGIDFTSPPPQTIHILNSNPPVYNNEKNYWEQEKEVLQYYVDEYKKIDYGVTIDGYYFDGWLYFHFNYFVAKIPQTIIKGGIKENEDVVKVPELRDNEIMITDYFTKSKREGLMSLIAATRRAAKTTMNASRLSRARVLGRKQALCAGGNANDLGHITANLELSSENMHPAFKLYFLSSTEDGKGKAYGIKTKNNKSRITANTYILNLEGGTTKGKKETLAGFTPDEFILDEAMKFPFKSQLEALEPALWGSGVLRCNVIITGTGGDEDLAADAIQMLNDPTGNRVTLMDWDSLEKNVPKDLITWKRKDFGLFLPTQMCIKHEKIKSNLSDYLGIKSDTLKKIPIWITNWEKAKESEEKEREEKIKRKSSYIRLLAYHPFDPTEIFLSGKENPFPVPEAKAHRDWLIESGQWDRRRDLYRDSQGNIRSEISTKELAGFPHVGNIDAPFLIFEDIPEEKPVPYLYTAGFDDYKQDDSDTDSVGTFQVWKMQTFGDKFGRKLVASLASKPEKHSKLHEQWLLLMEAYNLTATAFGENEDFSIKDFLDRKHVAEKYLAPSVNFTQAFGLSNNLKRNFGWTPRASKKTLFDLFVDYCNEEFVTYDEDGREIILKGVQKIDDIWLLEEIINYSENGNFDRITAAMGAWGYIHFLESTYVTPKVMRPTSKETQQNQQINSRRHNLYGNPRYKSSPYKR